MSQRWSFVVALVGVAAILLLARVVTRLDPGVRKWEVFTEMAYSVAGESFAAAPALPGGRVEQPLQPGVVVRGSTPFLFGNSPEEALRAGEELVNPFAAVAEGGASELPSTGSGTEVPATAATEPAAAMTVGAENGAAAAATTPTAATDAGGTVAAAGETTPSVTAAPDGAPSAGASATAAGPATAEDAAVARGGELYGIYCIVCHDAQGNGRGTVVERGMLPPPSLHAETALGMKDGQIFHLLTYGRGNMASYAAQLAPEDRWKVILFVRRLQKAGG